MNFLGREIKVTSEGRCLRRLIGAKKTNTFTVNCVGIKSSIEESNLRGVTFFLGRESTIVCFLFLYGTIVLKKSNFSLHMREPQCIICFIFCDYYFLCFLLCL